MAPAPPLPHIFGRQSAGPIIQNGSSNIPAGDWRQQAADHPEDLVLESWSQGFIVGALIVMSCITIANMRKGVILHKFILLELLLAMTHGTFCFMTFRGYGWYLSSTAALLYLSWIIHNVVAWMKVKPFFTQPGGFFRPKIGNWVRKIYLGTLALTVPVIIFQISDNFRFFNNRGGWYRQVRPYEPLMRDPWWVFTCIVLFHVIRKCYGTGVIGLIKKSPRFGILMSAIVLSIIFTILDIVASIHTFMGTTDGINPWWKLSLVFKCLTDTIMLDDFKTELKRLGIKRIEKEEARRNSVALVAEYPSGLDGPGTTDYSHPRRDTLFRYNHSPIASRNFSSDSTMMYNDTKDSRDENEDPLSEYAVQRDLKPEQKKKSSNNTNDNSNAQHEEVEFATALALDPRRVSGVESVSRDNQERKNIRSTTKKIGRLPGLREFKFEAIKPGKKSSRQNSDTSNDSSNDESDRRNSNQDPHDRDESFSALSYAEEINRNTIMDLESQKRLKEAEQRVKDRDRKIEQEKEEACQKRMEEQGGKPQNQDEKNDPEKQTEESEEHDLATSGSGKESESDEMDESDAQDNIESNESNESKHDSDEDSDHAITQHNELPSPPKPSNNTVSANTDTTKHDNQSSTISKDNNTTKNDNGDNKSSTSSIISHDSRKSHDDDDRQARLHGLDAATTEELEDAKREETHRRRMARFRAKMGMADQ